MLPRMILAPVGKDAGGRAEFDRCWPLLWVSLCEFGPTHTKEQVWFRVSNGKAFLWPGRSCAVLGLIIDWPIGLRDFNYWLQGGDLKELLTLHDGIEEWAITRGCHRATGYGREGWAAVQNGPWRKFGAYRMKWLAEPPLQVRA